jgi:LacI family transcriptional regulator
MLAERVDGLLLTPTQTNKGTVIELKASGFPFVLLGRRFDDLDTDYVVTDDVQGGFLATEHLLSLGREKIAMINGPLHISSAKERFQGYKKALEHFGIPLDRSIVKGGAITTDDGYEISKALLNHESCLTGIFAYSDFVAFGAMRAIREAGLKIPDDIAIIGYDNIEFSSCLEVPLTSIEIPEQKLGSTAVSILDERIRDRTKDVLRSILEVKLISRPSTTQMPQYSMQQTSTGR